jgi:hypothetical protein
MIKVNITVQCTNMAIDKTQELNISIHTRVKTVEIASCMRHQGLNISYKLLIFCCPFKANKNDLLILYSTQTGSLDQR